MNYVRNCWYVAAWAQDLSSDAPLGVRILDEPIVLWRTDVGTVSALEDRCVHRLAPL
jgi:vanillate O-demethylase monooxygenase subunit